jgi:hypothetical protein
MMGAAWAGASIPCRVSSKQGSLRELWRQQECSPGLMHGCLSRSSVCWRVGSQAERGSVERQSEGQTCMPQSSAD